MTHHQAPAPHRLSSETSLALCELEPIHIPGAIQPHGALLAALADGLLVTHASANLDMILGRPAEAVLGQPLQAAIGKATCQRLLLATTLRDGHIFGRYDHITGPDGEILHLRAHRSGRHICVDIEPVGSEQGHSSTILTVHPVLETFRRAAGCDELCELAVRGLKTITGYDRVMAYRFHDDGHGEVIAEACDVHLEPYLGLYYPAADVPSQARQLNLRQRVNAIADSAYQPVPLLTDATLDDGTPLDLTHSALRSVSPIHREYMRNMNTAAYLTVALVEKRGTNEQKLWGMLVCHHATPRIAVPQRRAIAEMIGEVVSLLLGSLADSELAARRLARIEVLRVLIDRLAVAVRLAGMLVGSEAELLRLVDATGVAARLSGKVVCLGRTPPPDVTECAFALLSDEAQGAVLAVDDLGLRYPELAGCADEASGALLVPFGRDAGDAILWFRPEVSRTVSWGGNPAEHTTWNAVEGRLAPRASFAAWKETMSGRSAPWTDADLAFAGDLRRAIEAEVARRARADLARVRDHDQLTGLPNQLTLAEQLTKVGRDAGAAPNLLLIDLDGCKAINDTMGYAAGDTMLIEVARRLVFVAGPPHFPSRLGGDQFAVLCRGLDPDAVAALGQRIRRAIEEPFEIAGTLCQVSVIIGTPVAGQAGGIDLMRAAETARQAAKAVLEAKQQAEEQRQKMEALGRMMGGVAHEINNMLQPVALLAQDVIDQGLVADAGRPHLDVVLECTEKARQIIGDLLAFSRPTQRSVEALDPATLLQNSLRLVRQAVPPSLELSVRIEGQPPTIAINRTTFVQILLNLVTNAAAAMDGRGELTISLDEVCGQRDRVFVRLRVVDTGRGMSKTTLGRAFEPFFTTKPVGQGTGLGLAVVYGLIHEMGGTITLDSEPGRGTTVTILIPVALDLDTAEAE
jgi:diguanylate cyclase (GGDEF)-like protein